MINDLNVGNHDDEFFQRVEAARATRDRRPGGGGELDLIQRIDVRLRRLVERQGEADNERMFMQGIMRNRDIERERAPQIDDNEVQRGFEEYVEPRP